MPFDATPVTSPMIELLEKVHARLGKGWSRKALYRESTDSYCLIGAISKEARSDISEALETLGFETMCQAVMWNDNYDRTQEQVLHRVTTAIQKQRAKLLLGG